MAIRAFAASNFRCLGEIEFEPGPEFTLIHGVNASGKTSILEAIGYLGRGRSFRGAATADLVRHGEREFVLFGKVSDGTRESRIGVRNGSGGLEVRIDGATGGGAAALVAAAPLQIIDPDVHDLVSGAPEERRRYLDWIAFHVEHGYLEAWRRFRRVLRQRNAALRSDAPGEEIRGWTTEFVAAAEQVDAGRLAAMGAVQATLDDAVRELLGEPVRFTYDAGWKRDDGLAAALAAAEARERAAGATQYGPHRAELKLVFGPRRARSVVSRGQQKLLACAMILAATETGQAALGRPMTLLIDDPAAELDGEALARLLGRVGSLGSQIIATSLEPGALELPPSTALFHVEHGALRAA